MTVVQIKKKNKKNNESTYVAPILAGKKNLLHLNSGLAEEFEHTLHLKFRNKDWNIIRMDNNPKKKADIVGGFYDLKRIADNQFDGIWFAHYLETLISAHVEDALKELKRILKTDGFLFFASPDLTMICEKIYKAKNENVVIYNNQYGKMLIKDFLFGQSAAITKGDYSRVPKNGFTIRTLAAHLKNAGFGDITVKQEKLNLWASGYKKAELNEQNQKPNLIFYDPNPDIAIRDTIEKPPYKVTGLENIK